MKLKISTAFELSAEKRSQLGCNGWVALDFDEAKEPLLKCRLLQLAEELGTPVMTRNGGDLIDKLSPVLSSQARPRSLSKIYERGEFPLHADTAHWLTPCRYIILACLKPGQGSRPTFLLDVARLSLSDAQKGLLRIATFRVVNGRNSFYSTILSSNRAFVRYDPGCMKPLSGSGNSALEVFGRKNWANNVESVNWQAGRVIILDNWRVLHGRGDSLVSDPDRVLLRVSIQ